MIYRHWRTKVWDETAAVLTFQRGFGLDALHSGILTPKIRYGKSPNVVAPLIYVDSVKLWTFIVKPFKEEEEELRGCRSYTGQPLFRA